jgi:hypothetical protein
VVAVGVHAGAEEAGAMAGGQSDSDRPPDNDQRCLVGIEQQIVESVVAIQEAEPLGVDLQPLLDEIR